VSDTQTAWLILSNAVAFGLLIATAITASELKRRCTKYRTAWGEAKARANDAQDKLARLNIRMVGIERENDRLRSEQRSRGAAHKE
jgi:aspartate oxidase